MAMLTYIPPLHTMNVSVVLEPVSGTGKRPDPELVQTTEHFYHVRVRPKEMFEELRTTQDAADQATEVVGAGTDVREGRLDSGTWAIESVLIPIDIAEDETEAETLTRQLVGQLES